MPNVEKLFNIVAGLASIAGLLLYLFVEHPLKGWIGASFVVLIAAYVARQVLKTVREVLTLKYPKGHTRLATFVRYTCLDGKTIEYFVHRVIQAKQPYLSRVEHGFKWSGTKQPIITCEPHTLSGVNYHGSEIEYDQVHVQLKDPILYNQVVVVPIKMVIDDSDHKSEPFVMQRVDEPSQLVSWRVELGAEKDRTSSPARLMRKALGSKHEAKWELMRQVEYHPIRKSYETELIHPQLGYHYRLSWDR
jgi:hypothetical protein